MNREQRDDFSLLKAYIDKYTLNTHVQKPKFIDELKNIHKYYFSLLHWYSEFIHQKSFFLETYTKNHDTVSRIEETISDIGSAKFNWIHGSYKSSRILIRCSIENFIRAISSIDDMNLLTIKNVYKLFDEAGNCSVFNKFEDSKKSFAALHQSYKELCNDTHTSTEQQMEKVSSLINYPKYIPSKSESTKNVFLSVVKHILVILNLSFNDLFQRMHHSNRTNILISIPKAVRPIVLSPSQS